MFHASLGSLVLLLCTLSHISNVLSSPVDRLNGLDSKARSFLSPAKRATPAAPHFVIYSDKFTSGLTGPPDVSQVEVCLSFHFWIVWFLMVIWTDFNVIFLFSVFDNDWYKGLQRFVRMICLHTVPNGRSLDWRHPQSALSFLLTEGAFDKAEEWTQLSADDRSSIKSQYEVRIFPSYSQ